LIHRLARAGAENDKKSVRDTISALIAEAHAQQKHGHASRLAEVLSTSEKKKNLSNVSSMLPDSMDPLIRESVPHRRLEELVLSKEIVREVKDFIEEYVQASLLRSHSLEPRHTVLLIGPPGTGKTSLATAIAAELALPFLTVRYEGLVGSYLGETASRLQQVVDYASRFPCVLFFDEFESVGKERADTQETGEIKRVVSSLLLHMDIVPTHCVIVCATNHPELLDRAVWRRFELRLELPLPSHHELREWFVRTERSLGALGMTSEQFVTLLQGESFSEIEAITLDARRKLVLSHGRITSPEAFNRAVQAWNRRRMLAGRPSGGVDRKNKPRAKKRRSQAGAETAVSEGDLLSTTIEPTRR